MPAAGTLIVPATLPLSRRARTEGPNAVAAAVTQIEGFEAPAGAWETEILLARIAEYEPNWLDDECLAGRVDGRDWRLATGDRTTPKAAA
jgi:ATP-dependent helicase Lhr and Lhr-like helicase